MVRSETAAERGRLGLDRRAGAAVHGGEQPVASMLRRGTNFSPAWRDGGARVGRLFLPLAASLLLARSTGPECMPPSDRAGPVAQRLIARSGNAASGSALSCEAAGALEHPPIPPAEELAAWGRRLPAPPLR